jgi:hypothetical protein
MDEDVDRAAEELPSLGAAINPQSAIGSQESWDRASTIVKDVRPVPWPVWIIARSVFGHQEQLGDPDPYTFDRFAYMLDRALDDSDITGAEEELIPADRAPLPLDYILAILGSDTAAALCFVHAASRRIRSLLPLRVGAPIIDEALLRAQIGYHLGRRASVFGTGRGILAGFAARSGLAMQFASGGGKNAEKALEQLAGGTNFHEVGLSVYGCDPLQVSAMALVAGGCGQPAAYGTAAFSVTDKVELEPFAFQWLSAFSVAEHLRLSHGELIFEEHWLALGVINEMREKVHASSKDLIRYGHSWSWILEPPSAEYLGNT